MSLKGWGFAFPENIPCAVGPDLFLGSHQAIPGVRRLWASLHPPLSKSVCRAASEQGVHGMRFPEGRRHPGRGSQLWGLRWELAAYRPILNAPNVWDEVQVQSEISKFRLHGDVCQLDLSLLYWEFEHLSQIETSKLSIRFSKCTLPFSM